jgi:hypothetical protein
MKLHSRRGTVFDDEFHPESEQDTPARVLDEPLCERRVQKDLKPYPTPYAFFSLFWNFSRTFSTFGCACIRQ